MNFKRPLRVASVPGTTGMPQSWEVQDSRKRQVFTARKRSTAMEVANALNAYPASERVARAAGRIVAFLAMVEAGLEMDGEALADDTPVMSYMGNGASDRIDASHLRELRAALNEYAQNRVGNGPMRAADCDPDEMVSMRRASHEMLCTVCGLMYLHHPYCATMDFLNVLCGGEHVKL